MTPFHHLALKNEADMMAVGAKIATIAQKGDVICLIGGLGAGKTTFARGFLQNAMCVGPDTEIPSPTFTLVQTYESEAFPIWHFDFYRIESPDDVYEIGLEEALDTGVSLIEWPEKAGDLLPEERLEILIEPIETGRQVRFFGHEGWAKRIEQLRISV